jgi:hypothetical protein
MNCEHAHGLSFGKQRHRDLRSIPHQLQGGARVRKLRIDRLLHVRDMDRLFREERPSDDIPPDDRHAADNGHIPELLEALDRRH